MTDTPIKSQMATKGKSKPLTHLMTDSREAVCGFEGKKFTRMHKSPSKVTCPECKRIIEGYRV